jgi:hypothetical protein
MRKPLVRAKAIYRNMKEELPTHLVDSTALMVASTPVFAGFESLVTGMPNESSLQARKLAVGLTYLGMGRLFTKGMDLSRKHFGITKESSEKQKNVHDALYAVTYNAVISPPFYFAAGVTNPWKITVGTSIAMGLALVSGGPMGYVVDTYRDLIGNKITGKEDSERLPLAVQKQSRLIKLGLAGLLIGASVGATSLIYKVNGYLHSSAPSVTNLENKIN